jgi:hypothetical protein
MVGRICNCETSAGAMAPSVPTCCSIAACLDETGRIDGDIDPARPADGVRHRPGRIAFDRHIAGQGDGLAAPRLDPPNQVIKPAVAPRRNGHSRTGLRQRRRVTDTRRGAL